MRERDSGGDTVDEDWGDCGVIGLVLACAAAVAVVISGPRPVAELRVPTFRGGRGGKSFAAVGLGVEVWGTWALGAAIGGTGDSCPLPGPFSTAGSDMRVADGPASCAASRLRNGFLEPMPAGALDPVACGVTDPSIRDIQAICTRIQNMPALGATTRARMEAGESKVCGLPSL